MAGATAGVGRARATRDAGRETEFFEPLASLYREIEDDRSSLEAIMRELGVERSKIKPPLAAVGERVGRLKPNGRLRDYSPLGRVIDLEVLLLGATGKLRLWTILGDLADGEISKDLGERGRRLPLSAQPARRRSTLKLRLAIEGSASPAALVATTRKVWVP